ncbi:MAG: PAS domain-containing sensor histidine kinase, partial [Paucibacter sp.]|nr:PAS domain-containing sensor histidine kinase [Roseateles sp.]
MSKKARWAWIIALVIITGICGVLAFLLSIGATSQRGFFDRHYEWLFWLNACVAGLLLLVIVGAAGRLFLRVRSGKFGSRLLMKLAGIFALVGMVPGLLIYGVSYQFVNRSIDSWFDVRLASALEAGLNLGRGTLDGLVNDLGNRTLDAAERLGEAGSLPQPLVLERLREQLSARTVALVASNGQILLSVGGDTSSLVTDRPADSLLRQARNARVISHLEGLEDEALALQGQARIRAIAQLPNVDLRLGLVSSTERFLMVVQRVPAPVLANALAVQNASSEYQQRALERDGLRRMYLGT